ncbi:MAG TPA: hypothetical protein VNQ57_10710 [Ureibacillus sp.]|nr:hypothetical protein [Ureibacillus sp.]
MKKLTIGCLGVLGIIVIAFTVILIVAGITGDDSTNNKTSEQSIEPIIDASKFSRITSAELVEIMGEPQGKEEIMWLVPSTGKEVPAVYYTYDEGKFEFMLIDDQITRLNVYSGQYFGYDDSVFEFDNENQLFSMFNINPSDDLKKIGDTGYVLRYSPVSEKVGDFWVSEIEGNKFGVAKITYNLNYY